MIFSWEMREHRVLGVAKNPKCMRCLIARPGRIPENTGEANLARRSHLVCCTNPKDFPAFFQSLQCGLVMQISLHHSQAQQISCGYRFHLPCAETMHGLGLIN